MPCIASYRTPASAFMIGDTSPCDAELTALAVVTGSEHVRHEWLSVDDALARFAFPSERISLREAVELLPLGHAGAVDDVMRIL